MEVHVIFITWVLLIVLPAQSFRRDTCIPLPMCQPAMDLILSKPYDPFTMKILRQSECGRAGRYLKVRCEDISVPCTTPDNRNGTCTLIKHCDPYINMLKVIDVSHPLTKKYLKEFRCDESYEKNDIHICCPEEKIELSEKGLFPKPELEQCGVQTDDNRVVGGSMAELDEYPWMALLIYRKTGKLEPACGGSLINDRYVVTAAHCADSAFLKGVGYTKLENVVLGEYDTRNETDCVEFEAGKYCAPPALTFKVDHYVLHPGWREKQHDDIALLRLDKQVQFTDFIKPICLPLAGMNLTGKENFYVAGWGATGTARSERRSPIKMKARIPLANKSHCLGLLNENQICAGEINGKDTCSGDSGGPLMLEHNVNSNYLIFLIGIVSYGPAVCGRMPAVYTYVPNYINWINEVIQVDRALMNSLEDVIIYEK